MKECAIPACLAPVLNLRCKYCKHHQRAWDSLKHEAKREGEWEQLLVMTKRQPGLEMVMVSRYYDEERRMCKGE